MNLSVNPKALTHVAGLVLLEELQTSADKCLLQAFVDLKITCLAGTQQEGKISLFIIILRLSPKCFQKFTQGFPIPIPGFESEQDSVDEAKGKLAIAWLNCQRRRSRWPEFVCGQAMRLPGCTSGMNPDDYTQFNMFYLKVNDICLAMGNEVARHKIELAVRDLHRTTSDAAHTTKQTLLEVLKLHSNFTTATQEATTRHQDLTKNLTELGVQARGQFRLLLTEITTSAEEHRAKGTQTKEAFEEVHRAFKESGMSVDAFTKSSLASMQESHQALQSVLNAMMTAHLQADEEHLEAVREIRQLQEEILLAQAEQTRQSRVIGETTQHMGGFLSTWLRAADFGWHLLTSFGVFLRSLAMYVVMLKFGDLLFSSVSSALKTLSRLLFFGGFLVEASFPHLVSATRIGLMLVVAFGLVAQIALSLGGRGSEGTAGNKGKDPEFGDANEGTVVPLLVDYIVQLKMTGGVAPMPAMLVSYLSTPPPCYIVGEDEDGDETLQSAEDD